MTSILFALSLSLAHAAEPKPVGCTAVAAERITADELEGLKKTLPKDGASVPVLAGKPGVRWDLGEDRTARLGVYLTRTCQLGLSTALGGAESSTPDPASGIASFGETVAKKAPDWTFSVTPPNTVTLRRGEKTYSTDLRKLLQARLDEGTPVKLGDASVNALFDGWLLFVVPQDASKALNLSVVSTVSPWALYDLTPYGMPRLLARFDKGAKLFEPGTAVLWALP